MSPRIWWDSFQEASMSKLLRFPAVHAKTGGLCRTTIWRLEQEGLFPKRRKVGPKFVVWDEKEIDDWIISREKGCGMIPGTRKADGVPK